MIKYMRKGVMKQLMKIINDIIKNAKVLMECNLYHLFIEGDDEKYDSNTIKCPLENDDQYNAE